jgi:hypothetical protein
VLAVVAGVAATAAEVVLVVIAAVVLAGVVLAADVLAADGLAAVVLAVDANVAVLVLAGPTLPAADDVCAAPAVIAPVITAAAAKLARPVTRRARRAGCGRRLRDCNAASLAAAAALTSVLLLLSEFGSVFI